MLFTAHNFALLNVIRELPVQSIPYWKQCIYYPSKFYSPEAVCDCRLPRGPIEYSFHFIGVGNGTGGFKNTL